MMLQRSCLDPLLLAVVRVLVPAWLCGAGTDYLARSAALTDHLAAGLTAQLTLA